MRNYIILFILFPLYLFPQPINYFPHSIGDKFQFTTIYFDYFSDGEIGKDSLFENGKTYFDYPFDALLSRNLRVDSSGNIFGFSLNGNQPQESFLFKNNVQKDESWLIRKDPYIEYLDLYGRCDLDTIMNIFGKNRHVKIIIEFNNHENLYYYALAEDLGVLFYGDYLDGGELRLNYAKIDGIEYGTLYSSDNLHFFPLAVGNEYQFKQSITHKYLYGKINRDTTYNNGLTYFSFPKSIVEFGEIRSDNDGYLWSNSQPFSKSDSIQEYLLFNPRYGPQIGEYWTVAYNVNPIKDNLLGQLFTNATANFFGKVIRIKYISIYNKEKTFINYILGEGIGLVGFQYPGQAEWILNYANINGVKYGELVDVYENTEVVNNYSLSQNYPNPFNPTTTIRYSIKESGLVTIKIFNSIGAEVMTLINGQKPAGEYEIKFNASQLPSGVYFYRINAGNFSGTKKMILLK